MSWKGLGPSGKDGRRLEVSGKGNGSGSITRGDIEAKLRSIRDSIEPVGEQAKGGLKAVLPVVAAAIVVLAAYVAGKRRGKKRRAIIEIRRI